MEIANRHGGPPNGFERVQLPALGAKRGNHLAHGEPSAQAAAGDSATVLGANVRAIKDRSLS